MAGENELTHIRIRNAAVKKIAFGEGKIEMTFIALATELEAEREDLDEASAPTFFADVKIVGERKQAMLIVAPRPKED